MDIKTHTMKLEELEALHDEFARLPRAQREAAYQAVRARVGPTGLVRVEEMLYVAREML